MLFLYNRWTRRVPPLIDQVEDFDWLPWIEEKIIVKHGVQPYEVEQCFFDPDYKTRCTKNDTYQLLVVGRHSAVVDL